MKIICEHVVRQKPSCWTMALHQPFTATGLTLRSVWLALGLLPITLFGCTGSRCLGCMSLIGFGLAGRWPITTCLGLF